MKINEIIRQRRKELSLTQEEVAQLLGVSAPAVNKWESGVSYPDITLLPPLARLLKIDLNTLLSFKEDLTKDEITKIVEDISRLASQGDLEGAVTLARKQAQEYPNCLPLIYALASVLNGFLIMLQPQSSSETAAIVQRWLKQCAQAEEQEVREGAINFLFYDALKQKRFEEAHSLLEQLPKPTLVDRQQLQINLYLGLEETDKAMEMMEKRLIQTANNMMMQLGTLANLTHQDHPETSQRYLVLSKMMAEQFDLMPYNLAYADWTAAMHSQDSEVALTALEAMFKALKTPWNPAESALYSHVRGVKESSTFGALLAQSLRKALPQDETLEFLRQSPRYETVLQQIMKMGE